MNDTGRHPTWTFLTNHARVLRLIADEPNVRIRDIAATIGITERAVGSIVNDLRDAGYIEVRREGRRNRYTIVPGRHLRHPSQRTIPIQALLALFNQHDSGDGDPAHAPRAASDGAGTATDQDEPATQQ
ncbi:helix-turn-helix transcriptional regulator [Nonomuraea sp. SYSU D8015]|uniref:helix-turn-helix transcriptional regulator n=1 Tax=Nonomuraea sp. SYSU D8015 TaxID=2593644 RepID=UPI00166112CE|nr:winged helix-turn-helix domain-containing protein [Nonomuraea sp. SYSU D8015]